MFAPVPQTGRTGQVTLDGIDLQLVPGSWSVGEAERFSDKIAQGAISYADFNVYEQAWDVIDLSGGYGLKNVSDLPRSDPKRRFMYHEADGVDCRESGLIVLGPKLQISATVLTGTPIWIGEFTPSTGALAAIQQLVVVTSDGKVYTVNADFTLTLRITLPDVPTKSAIGTFNGKLVIGYSALRTAQYSTDLVALNNVTNSTPASVYAWAFTADQASAFLAGGPLATDWWRVTSSTNGGTSYSDSAADVKCGDPDKKITGLAPGGGVVNLFVGRETEVGEVDTAAAYRTLLPFDSRLSTNCRLFRWILASGGAEQRGPLMLYFSRERSLWSYQPQQETAGDAKNISPWSATGIRPDHIRGIPTALQGSARWTYYTVTNNLTGTYYLIAQDTRTGADHGSIVSLGTNQCQAMTISNLIGTSPRLYLGYGNAIATVILPLDGDAPVGNPAYEYAASGTLDLAEIDWDFPDEQKILFVIRLIAENLVPASRYIEVYASYDGAAYVLVDTVSNSPAEISFPAATSVRRVGIRLKLYTDSVLQSPQIKAIVPRGSINPKLYRVWEFQAKLPAGSQSDQSDDMQNPYQTVETLWSAREDGTPVTFVDRWSTSWGVRILALREQEGPREVDRTLNTVLTFKLLQVQRDYLGASVWDDPVFIWDEPTSIWSVA